MGNDEAILADDNNYPSRSIPEDVLIEILCYLPVKSLKRFSSVCKSWRYLINSDPNFAMKHYFTRSSTPTSVIDNADHFVAYPCARESFILTILTENDKTLPWLKKLELAGRPALEWWVSSCCHGIMCICIYHGHILLCNPSTQEVVLVPQKCPLFRRFDDPAALGFDPISKDYKVVAVASTSHEVAVYSLRKGQWQVVASPHYLKESYKLIRQQRASSNVNGRFCNWLIKIPTKRCLESRAGLITFDMVEEVLRKVSLPKCECHNQHPLFDGGYPFLYPVHELLPSTRYQACLSCFTYFNRRIEIWVLQQHDGQGEGQHMNQTYWNRQHSVILPELPNNQILDYEPLKGWMNDRELLVRLRDEIYHCDLQTSRYKQTGCCNYTQIIYGFVASLISIKGFMSSSSSDGDNKGNSVFREIDRYGVKRSYDTFKFDLNNRTYILTYSSSQKLPGSSCILFN